MATSDRPPPQHLSFLQRAAEVVKRWGLFPIVRAAEARAPGMPRVGRSRLPSQNVVDLTSAPSMSFAETTLERLEERHGRPRLRGYWPALIGPMGALPTHLTEFAVYESRYAKARPFGDWLDVLAGRSLQFFYRAWADSQPATWLDRPDDDKFGDWLAALSGAREGVRPDSAFPAQARLHYAALFASRRSAAAIEDGLGHLMRQPVRLLEYQPRWREIEREDRTRIGRAFARLGDDAVLGARVRAAADAFRVVIRASSYRDYKALLPTGRRFAVAAEALNALTPSHLEWDIALEIDEMVARPARLDGQSQLGWTGWIATPGTRRIVRADAHLRRPMRVRRGIGQQ